MSADPTSQVQTWLHQFETTLARSEAKASADLFATRCFWRDMVAFTWNIHTCEGKAAVADLVERQAVDAAARNWAIDGAVVANPEGWVEAWFRFDTRAGRGKGHVRLIDGKCFTLLTTLSDLHAHPAAVGRLRERGLEHKVARGRKTWAERSAERRARLGVSEDPYVAIVGGGQGAMALAARLKQSNVPTLVLERNARAGDSWRNRYPSLCLHDPVWYDHMPFIPFPPDWPVFTPKDRMGDWLEAYARVLDLDYWAGTLVRGAKFDTATDRWTIEVTREGAPVTLRAHHLVFATGMSGYPHVPQVAGQNEFRGIQMHSSRYPGGRAFAGKRCVVVGSNTSAHDICADLWEHGAQVTMLQRSGTLVVESDTVLDLHLAPLYSEDALERGIDTEKADYIATTWPHRVVEERQKAVCAAMRERDKALHDRLRAAGFLLDFGPDETGLALKSIREGGGFYINVGASELICNGSIALEAGVQIEGLTRDAVLLSNGRTLPAEVIVYATGYRSMNEFVADIVGRGIADDVGRCWGVGSGTRKDPGPWEGELRNMWKPTAHHALWFQGGNLAQSRHFSRFLAVQLKARMEGVPVQVYPPRHPKRP
jgi:putative flavoprotein involved in K+ transport